MAPQVFNTELGPDNTKIPIFLDQSNETVHSSVFSVFYSLNTALQSKIIFGPANATFYGKQGSTNDDIKYA